MAVLVSKTIKTHELARRSPISRNSPHLPRRVMCVTIEPQRDPVICASCWPALKSSCIYKSFHLQARNILLKSSGGAEGRPFVAKVSFPKHMCVSTLLLDDELAGRLCVCPHISVL